MSHFQRRLPRLAVAVAIACSTGTAVHALAQGVVTHPSLPPQNLEDVAILIPGAPGCSALTPQALSRLTLLDTVRHVLCRSPPLGQAVQLVFEQQAGVELARSAYRPRYWLSAELASNRIPTSDSGAGSLHSSFTASLGVSWVL